MFNHRICLAGSWVAAAMLVVSACTTSTTQSSQPGASSPGTASPTGATSQPSAATPTSLTVLCGAQEDWCQAMTQAFQAKTGITTAYVRMSSGEALARLRVGAAAPEFSVWFGGPADGYIAAAADGLLESYVSPNAAVVPEQYKDGSGLWTGVYVGALGFCSNKDVLDKLGVKVPGSWSDLLDPALRGQVVIAHPATSGTAFTAVWTKVTLEGGDIDKAFAYFRELHNNILQYTKSGSAPGQMVGRGEAAVAVIFSHDCVKFSEEGMSSLVVSFPSEGTGYEIGGVAVIQGAPEPEAARMWVDWVLTAEAQEIGATVKSYQLPTVPDARVSDKSVKLTEVSLVDYDAAAGEKRAAVGERFDADIAPAPKE